MPEKTVPRDKKKDRKSRKKGAQTKRLVDMTLKSTPQNDNLQSSSGTPCTVQGRSIPRELRSSRLDPDDQRVFVLDTNVLLSDPGAIFKFREHDIYLPRKVLRELDKHKSGMADLARCAREASRAIEELLAQCETTDVVKGVKIQHEDYIGGTLGQLGTLHFQQLEVTKIESLVLDPAVQDEELVLLCLHLKKLPAFEGVQVIFVSRDINARSTARVYGVTAEDYLGDTIRVPESDDARTVHRLSDEAWMRANPTTVPNGNGHTYYKIPFEGAVLNPNEILEPEGAGTPAYSLVVDSCSETEVVAHLIGVDYFKQKVFGAQARNMGQHYFLHALLNPDFDIVFGLGEAGSGKTFLATAAGLEMVMEKKLYREVIYCRAAVPVGEDIGFLPGDADEKMGPWTQGLWDNIEELIDLTSGHEDAEFAERTNKEKLRRFVKTQPLSFIRGRTLSGRYLIIDEAQNLTHKQLLTLITRAAEGTKVVCLGNVAQIDTPFLTSTTTGLVSAAAAFRPWSRAFHIKLEKCERSLLAAYAGEHM